MDEVITKFIELENRNGFCSAFYEKYGAPIWNITNSVSNETEHYLTIPVITKNKKNISSILVFKKTKGEPLTYQQLLPDVEYPIPDKNYKKIFKNYEDLIIDNYQNKTIRIVPELSDNLASKGYIVTTVCYVAFTSLDGGATFEPANSWCSTYIDFLFDTGVWGDEGGGGFGGGTTTSEPLTTDEAEKLEETIDEVSDWCPTVRMLYELLNDLNFAKKPGASQEAGYNPNTNTIWFKNYSSINADNFSHELFHGWQNSFYQGGIAQYNKTGWSNIEFETYVFNDISIYIHTNNVNNLFLNRYWLSRSMKQQYSDWIRHIAVHGFDGEFPDAYIRWLNRFVQFFTPSDGKPHSTTPDITNFEALENLLSNCD